MSTFEYRAELQLNDGSLVPIDLEEHGWAEPERLSLTRVFTLVPKDPSSRWPFIRVHVPEGAKPIFKSRMNSRLLGPAVQGAMGEPIFRAYAVGWFKDGESHWTWVFPNGSIEQETDEPTFNDLLVKAANDASVVARSTGNS
jgi:hypothetical protein